MNQVKTKDQPEVKNPKGYIILDTNILIHLGHEDKKNSVLREQMEQHMWMLLEKYPGFFFAISAITKYELINKTDAIKEGQREVMLSGVKCFNVTMPVIRLAGRLGTFYKRYDVPEEQVELPDKIIASTSFQVGAGILTTNPSDYPVPFFKEYTDYRKIIEYPGKNKYPVFVVLYLMVPQGYLVKSLWKERKTLWKEKGKIKKK